MTAAVENPSNSNGWLELFGYLAAWALAVAVAMAPWFAIRYVPVEVNSWASIYVAGALGGLALELLLGRGRVELPGPSVATDKEQLDDERRPLGTLLDLGFLARVASSGLAATALLLVYHALVDEAATQEAFNEIASDPSTFGWGIFLGASSPAIWTASQQWVKSRIEAVTAENDAKIKQHQTLRQGALKELTAARASTSPTATLADVVTEDGRALARRNVESVLAECEQALPGQLDIAGMSDVLSAQLFSYPVRHVGAPAAADIAAIDRALGILQVGLTDDPVA